MMTIDEFRSSLRSALPPSVPPPLVALWHDARGNWDDAHRVAQDVDDPRGAWVHAYLHRKEGDLENARYWYRRAGQTESTDSTDSEWTRIVLTLLGS
jgi:hypothetical protein